MAFLAESGDEKFFFLDRYIGSNRRLKEFVYITPDDLTTILVPGYFTFAWSKAIRPGDAIRVIRATDRTNLTTYVEEYSLVITAVTGTILTVITKIIDITALDLSFSELTALTGGDAAAGDVLAIEDISAALTKKISLTELNNALGGIAMATRAALAATLPQAGTRYLSEAGRAGFFRWDASNLSTNVTADPSQGVYVAPSSDTTGASGAWVRVYNGSLHATWFGVLADGTTNNSTNFQAAITLLEFFGGGRLQLPVGVIGVSTTITISGNNIFLEGYGAGHYQPIPSVANIRASAATRIVRLSGGGATPVIKFTSPAGALRKQGGGIRGIMIDGAAIATSCLQIESRAFGNYENVALVYAIESNLLMNVLTTEVLSGIPYDTQNNTLINVFAININSPACDGAYAFRVDSFESSTDPTSVAMGSPNVSFNTFINCTFRANTQYATWLVGFTDNAVIASNASVETALSTDRGWVLCSSTQDTALGWASAKRNSFFKCAGKIWARAGQTGGSSSVANMFYGHQSSVALQFEIPYVIETPAGGSQTPEVWAGNEYGYIDHVDLYAEYTNIRTTYKRGGLRTATTALTMDAATKTATGLIPAGAIVFGVATRVTTQIVNATGYHVGDGTDVDRWGASIPFNGGTVSDNSDWTAATIGVFPAGNNVVLTAVGGTPTAGVVNISVFYMTSESAYSA